jgi:hypothetical protein
MALSDTPVGTNVADYFVNNAPTAGSPVTKEQLEAIWQGAMGIIYGDIKENADVVPVAHSGENLSAPAGQPVTIPSTADPGSPSSGETTADTVLDGKGSIE